MTLEDIEETKSLRITREIILIKLAPSLYNFLKRPCLKNMYMFARLDEIPLMTLRKQNILCK